MKTKMKFAVCALVCMTMACAAASAEGNQPGGMGGNRPQMQQGQMKDDKKGGMPQGQAPNMNGQNNGQNQAPDMNGQNNGQNQTPNMNGQNQAPNMNGQGNAQNGQQKPDNQNAPKDMPTRLDTKKLLEDGVIDEDTYNAIEAYLKENAPEKPEGGEQDGQQPPEKPEGEQDDTQQPPEKPEGEQDDTQQPPEKPEGEQDDTQQPPEKPDSDADDDNADQPELPEIGGGLDEVQLKNLLDAGVITQEQYDAIVALLGSGENAA